MFLFAVTLFLIGSLGCGAAPSMLALILFRVIQGFGGSGLFTVVVIMVSDMFEDLEERARYQSMVWLAFAVSAVTGPLLGGAFVQRATWRWCFYICLPLGALSMSLVAWLFQVPFEQTNISEKMRRVDYLGVILVTATVLCLLLPLTWGGTTFAWNSAPIIVLLVLFVVLACILVFVENRTLEEDAIIPPALLLNRNVALAVSINGLVGICFMGCMFYLPLYFQAVKGASTTSSGLRLIPNSFGAVISTMASSFLLKKLRDYRIFLWMGTAIMTLSIGLLMLLDADTSLGVQLVLLLIMGFGQGLIYQNCVIACQDCAGEKHIAVATTLCGFLNGVGSAIGVAICASVFNNALQKNLAKLPIDTQDILGQMDVVENMTAISSLPEGVKEQVIGAYADSFKMVFMVLTPIMGVAFILSLFMRRRKIIDKA
ncbi:hypothetical protein BGZ58_004107 [Dissophora ornata]|nr:hypothetical protein BGZ58_004107 [Dissophora ornata]